MKLSKSAVLLRCIVKSGPDTIINIGHWQMIDGEWVKQ